jgi:hypothetical protein
MLHAMDGSAYVPPGYGSGAVVFLHLYHFKEVFSSTHGTHEEDEKPIQTVSSNVGFHKK